MTLRFPPSLPLLPPLLPPTQFFLLFLYRLTRDPLIPLSNLPKIKSHRSRITPGWPLWYVRHNFSVLPLSALSALPSLRSPLSLPSLRSLRSLPSPSLFASLINLWLQVYFCLRGDNLADVSNQIYDQYLYFYGLCGIVPAVVAANPQSMTPPPPVSPSPPSPLSYLLLA